MTTIKPSVGRVVWFWQGSRQVQPYAAMIAYVHTDTLINIGYFNETGAPAGAMRVRLVQEGEERPKPPFCTWLPYQLGQAAKTEEVEAKLREAQGGL